MREFKFHVPVEGMLDISICAEDINEAIEILTEKQEVFEQHPLGHLNLLLDNVLAIEANPKIVS